MQDNFISEREAAILTGVSRPTLRRYRKMGVLSPIKTKHALLYSKLELEIFALRFEARRNLVPPQLTK
jgi:DNA-binding transcriptional MerR regulator